MLTTHRHFLLRVINIALLGTALLLAFPTHLFGYTDPGTGAFLYQAAYAAFIGGAFYFRKFLGRIFRKRQ